MKRFALTGGIGCGKSTVADYFRRTGRWRIFDADAVCHDLYAGKAPLLIEKLCARWGETLRAKDGSINRKVLADIVFCDPSARAELNALVHPAIHAAICAEVAALPASEAVLFDVPLLYECGWTDLAPQTVSVWAPPAIQRQRLRGRGWTDAEIDVRLASQLSADEKLERADYGIINSSTPDALYEQCAFLDQMF